MNAGSLRARLMLAGTVAIVVALAAAGLALSILFERHLRRNLADDLDIYLRQLVATVDVSADGTITLARLPADPRFAEPLSGLYWQVTDDAGQLLRSRSLWDAVLALPPDEPVPGDLHRHELAGPAGQNLLVAERRVRFTEAQQHRWIRLAVAVDLARIAAARRAMTRELAVALAILGLALGCAAWAQIWLGLRPLDAIRRGVAAIRSGTARRLAATLPREVQPLADEVNALLDAQDRAMARARARAADLAHGLKTPLTALAADARRLRGKGEVEIAADLDALSQSMQRHVDRELVRVRIGAGGRGPHTEVTRLGPLVDALVATLARTPRGERLSFDRLLPADAVVPIERTDLAEVLGNLMENAARHARTRVRVTSPADDASVVVEDDGPGIAAEDRGRVLERGRRLDTSGSGAGLGLAIVQDVLDVYGWRLELGSSELGGLAARITPAAGP